ncbi:hypothetical protein HG530_001071 [Fusarium avenaceum]|nr:hypothetical protein HG530_001071 [Fusarium avenaceum]
MSMFEPASRKSLLIWVAVAVADGKSSFDLLPDGFLLFLVDVLSQAFVVLCFYREFPEGLLLNGLAGVDGLGVEALLTATGLELCNPLTVDRARRHALAIVMCHSREVDVLVFLVVLGRYREHGTFGNVFEHCLDALKRSIILRNRHPNEFKNEGGFRRKPDLSLVFVHSFNLRYTDPKSHVVHSEAHGSNGGPQDLPDVTVRLEEAHVLSLPNVETEHCLACLESKVKTGSKFRVNKEYTEWLRKRSYLLLQGLVCVFQCLGQRVVGA